jgi:hypothetical protein
MEIMKGSINLTDFTFFNLRYNFQNMSYNWSYISVHVYTVIIKVLNSIPDKLFLSFYIIYNNFYQINSNIKFYHTHHKLPKPLATAHHIICYTGVINFFPLIYIHLN